MGALQPPMLPRPPRLFHAQALLRNEVNLDGYPFRYVCLSSVGAGMSYNSKLDVVLAAVEVLEPRGWELVSVSHTDGTIDVLATLRRTL